MKINNPLSAPNYYELAGNIRPGKRDTRVLLTGEQGSPANYRLFYGQGVEGENWTTPRHHHNFEQIRFPLDGDYVIGKDRVLPAGWIGYFPEAVYYGPQVMTQSLTKLDLQYGGPSGLGYMSVAQRRQGHDELLAKGGRFERGVYTWTDAAGKRHNQDAFEACWEQVYGKKIIYPKPRYEALVLMNPENFGWMEDEESPGVAYKLLGAFTERNVRVAFIRMEAKASLLFGTEKSSEILFLKTGSLSHDGQTYERLSAFGTAAQDGPETLVAIEPSELFYIKLPTF